MKTSKINNAGIKFPEIRGNLAGINFPALADVKIDGELNFITLQEEDNFTVNKYGAVRKDFPVLRLMKKAFKGTNAMLVGEVYWGEGKLGALYDLLSKKKDDGIKIKIFDIIAINHSSTKSLSLLKRKELIHEAGLGHWAVECAVVDNKKSARKYFNKKVNEGYEGIVVKDFTSPYISGPCSWVKMKFKDQNDYKVLLVDAVKERIEVGVPSPKGPDMIRVGVKAPNRYKAHISVGDTVTIEHQGILFSGSLRHPVLIPKSSWK